MVTNSGQWGFSCRNQAHHLCLLLLDGEWPGTRCNTFAAILSNSNYCYYGVHVTMFSFLLAEGMKLYISDNKVILTEGFDGTAPVKYFEKIETWPGRQPIPF